jgi:hypothetical protein
MRFPLLAVFVAFAACLVVSSEPQGDCGAGDECAAAADMTSEASPAPLGARSKDTIEVPVRDCFAVGREGGANANLYTCICIFVYI